MLSIYIDDLNKAIEIATKGYLKRVTPENNQGDLKEFKYLNKGS